MSNTNSNNNNFVLVKTLNEIYKNYLNQVDTFLNNTENNMIINNTVLINFENTVNNLKSLEKNVLDSNDEKLKNLFDDFFLSSTETTATLKTKLKDYNLNQTLPNLPKVNVIPPSPKGKNFSDIIGQQDVKNTLLRVSSDLSKTGKSILLYGAPGTSKTLTSQAFANQIGYNFIEVPSGTLQQNEPGKAAQQLNELFQLVTKSQPCILFIDELDGLLPQVRDNSTEAGRSAAATANALLEFTNSLPPNVIFIGATNNPDNIDSAQKRRFNEQIRFNLPNKSDIKRLIDSKGVIKTDNKKVEKNLIEKIYEGYSPAEILKEIDNLRNTFQYNSDKARYYIDIGNGEYIPLFKYNNVKNIDYVKNKFLKFNKNVVTLNEIKDKSKIRIPELRYEDLYTHFKVNAAKPATYRENTIYK